MASWAASPGNQAGPPPFVQRAGRALPISSPGPLLCKSTGTFRVRPRFCPAATTERVFYAHFAVWRAVRASAPEPPSLVHNLMSQSASISGLGGEKDPLWIKDLGDQMVELSIPASSTTTTSKAVHWHPVDGLFHWRIAPAATKNWNRRGCSPVQYPENRCSPSARSRGVYCAASRISRSRRASSRNSCGAGGLR